MMRLLLLCLLLLAGPAPLYAAAAAPDAAPRTEAWAQWQTPRFLTLDGSAGLPHATATAIAQSSDGLMWIGTRGGLARYDGQRIKTFRQSPGDLSTLPDNYIRALLPLEHGAMLVGTNVGGVVRFDPMTGRFQRLTSPADLRSGARILAFAPDGRNGALIASDHGVFRYRAADHRIVSVMGATSAARDFAGGTFAVHRDADGTIMAGGDHGLFIRRVGSAGFVPFGPVGIGDVWAITRDRAGRLWIGTGSSGIFIQLPGGRFVQPPALGGDTPLIGHRTIRAFAPGADGVMWAGTDGMGVLRIVPGHGVSIHSLRNIAANPHSLAGDTVRDLTLDRAGRLWAATEGGASHADPDRDAMFTITTAMPGAGHSLAGSNVRGVMVDAADRIWVGMSNGLIDCIDPGRIGVRHLRLMGRHAGQDIKAFVERADGAILAGGRGVIAIDPRSWTEREIPLPLLGDLPVISLAYQGRLLLIGTYRGLFAWDARTQRMTRYQHDEADGDSLANNEVINIVAQPDGRPWIATPDGISRFDPATGRFTTFRNRPGDPDSLPQNYTGSIIRTDAALWVGTYGGVARGTPAGTGWRFRAITEAEGLVNDNVASVLTDRGARAWAATAGGISVVDADGSGVRTLSRRDGVTSDAFNQRAAAVTRAGDLLFGSTGGLVVVRPDRMLTPRAEGTQVLVATEAEQDGRPLILDHAADRQTIHIMGGRHTVRIGFALTDYAAPQEIRYAYRLDGFDDAWVSIPAATPASATYTNLPGGDYRLQLRAVIPGINPRIVTSTIDLVVERAWYELWFVRLAAVAALLLAMAGIVHLRTLVLSRRTRALEKVVDTRTQELRAANASLEHLAGTDPLTGLANRRTLMARLGAEHQRAARTGRSYALAMLDIDHFKRVNDTYGHPVGDRVLKAIVERISDGVRATDCVARYGGEEIAILFAEASAADAYATTDRIRTRVAATPIRVDDVAIAVTLSGGVAAAAPGIAPDALLLAADLALYRAKKEGRNRIARADETVPS